jgi:UDP-N-acetylmuramoylalanine--D-glutamate ligase
MYLVAGLGLTGQSVLRYFQAQGEPCLAFDTREDFDLSSLKESFPEFSFAQGELPKPWKEKISQVVLSPGISTREPWVEDLSVLNIPIIGDIELFARAVGNAVVAITGSNGKSTVTTLVGEVLREAGFNVAVGGNIGKPVLDQLIDEQEYDVYVLELSSFQLETTYSLQSVSATVLNISEDHMDRYLGIEEYIHAKTKVYANNDLAVVPNGLSIDGLICQQKVVHFGLNPPKNNQDFGLIKDQGRLYLGKGTTPLVDTQTIRLQGKHHFLNALAMMALVEPFKVETDCFNTVLKRFSGLPHRTELVTVHNGVTWINDSKGTNVGATLTALASLGEQTLGQLVLIAGGVGKDADFSGLTDAINRFCRAIVLFGQDASIIAKDLQQNGLKSSVALIQVKDLIQAVNHAQKYAKADDLVLFSPACASFDQFDNYMHRGDVFSQLVHETCERDA